MSCRCGTLSGRRSLSPSSSLSSIGEGASFVLGPARLRLGVLCVLFLSLRRAAAAPAAVPVLARALASSCADAADAFPCLPLLVFFASRSSPRAAALSHRHGVDDDGGGRALYASLLFFFPFFLCSHSSLSDDASQYSAWPQPRRRASPPFFQFPMLPPGNVDERTADAAVGRSASLPARLARGRCAQITTASGHSFPLSLSLSASPARDQHRAREARRFAWARGESGRCRCGAAAAGMTASTVGR